MAAPKEYKVSNISPWSLAKTFGWVQAVLGFIVGAYITFAVAVGAIVEGSKLLETLGVSLVVAGFSIVLIPILAYLVGWVQGLVAGWILSVVFKETGGLRIELTEQ